MTKYFQPSTKGFFDSNVHGARQIQVSDPEWDRPYIEVEILPGESAVINGEQVVNDGDTPITMETLDRAAQPPLILVDNPACLIPVDAVEITDEAYQALTQGNHLGLSITVDSGIPVLVPPAPPTDDQLLQAFQRAHDAYINAPALARRYDSFVTFALRASRPGPWQADGQVFFDWMEECNTIGYALLDDVRAGIVPPPASVEAYIAMLPICPLDVAV